MKIATYNVNGVNGRLPVLLRWLVEAQPDVVCLQELKTSQEKFPLSDIHKAGYGAVWYGQKAWNGVAILARGADPVETRRGLPGEPEDQEEVHRLADPFVVGNGHDGQSGVRRGRRRGRRSGAASVAVVHKRSWLTSK